MVRLSKALHIDPKILVRIRTSIFDQELVPHLNTYFFKDYFMNDRMNGAEERTLILFTDTLGRFFYLWREKFSSKSRHENSGDNRRGMAESVSTIIKFFHQGPD